MYTVIIFEEQIRGIFDEEHNPVPYLKSILKNVDIYDDDFQEELQACSTLEDIVDLCNSSTTELKIYQGSVNSALSGYCL